MGGWGEKELLSRNVSKNDQDVVDLKQKYLFILQNYLFKLIAILHSAHTCYLDSVAVAKIRINLYNHKSTVEVSKRYPFLFVTFLFYFKYLFKCLFLYMAHEELTHRFYIDHVRLCSI